MAKKKEDPKLESSQRIALFNNLQETTFKSLGVDYDKNNALKYESYRVALKNLGLADPFLNLKLPESLFDLDLSKESGIIGAIQRVATEYSNVLNSALNNPRGALTSLETLFRADYNPKFADFASSELSKINIEYDALTNILDQKDEDSAREEAEGTGLEGTISNPSNIARGVLESIQFKYLKSFGASLDPAGEKSAGRDLVDYVQKNLSKDSPAKKSTASSKSEDIETSKSGSAINVPLEKSESSKKEDSSPINEPEKGIEKEKSFLEPEKITTEPVKSEVVSAPLELPKEESPVEIAEKKEIFSPVETKKEESVQPQASPINTVSEKSEKFEKSESKISSFSELGQTLNILPKEISSDIEKVYEKTLESSSINLKDQLKEKISKETENKTSETFKGENILSEKEKSSTINDVTSNLSAISNFDKTLSEKKLEYLKSIGINIPGEEVKSVGINIPGEEVKSVDSRSEGTESAMITSSTPGIIENKIDVAREKINFPQAEKEKISISKPQGEEVSPKVKEASESLVPIKEPQPEKIETQTQVSEKVDLTPLIMRLARLENLLSGTLEVKLVE